MNADNLPEYGVAIFSIGALVYVIKAFLTFMKNHLMHHTEVDEKLAEAVKELLNYLKFQNGKMGKRS